MSSPVSTHEASRWALRAGRAGVAAQGLLYVVFAWIAGQIALSGGSESEASSGGALATLAAQPFGFVLLVVLALGFAAYIAWQVFELTGKGLQGPSTVNRVKAAAMATVGVVLLVTTIRVLAQGSAPEGGEEEATSTVLAWPGGRVLVGLVGLAIIGLAGYLVVRGFRGKIREKLTAGVSQWLIRLGQFGDVARGAAFATIGVLLVTAAVTYDSETAGGLDAALGALREQPFGPYLVFAVALGLGAWGVFCVLTARHHREA